MTGPRQRPLDQALARLYARNLHTIKLGLETQRALMRELGNPENDFLSIHVAGTNGKGSVCALLASILCAAGFRVGLYTSPHLVAFNERIQVNGTPISDGELAEGIDAVEAAVARARAAGERDATFFEFTTALAFRHFQRAGVQLVVAETGMGGRLDATNILTPLVSVITSIGFDHMKWLGDTLEKIAGEKSGIIKPGRPVVIGELPDEADDVMRATARERGAPLTRAAEVCSVARVSQTIEGQRLRIETPDGVMGSLSCPLIGRHQLANIAVAVAALREVEAAVGRSFGEDPIRAGLASVSWPARAQLIERDPPTLLDGAHNPQAMAALRRVVEEVRGERKVCLLAGFLADKDAVHCLAEWRGIAQHLFLTRIDSERAMSDADLVAAAARAGFRDGATPVPLHEALEAARAWSRANGALLIIAGSLYLAGAVMQARA